MFSVQTHVVASESHVLNDATLILFESSHLSILLVSSIDSHVH